MLTRNVYLDGESSLKGTHLAKRIVLVHDFSFYFFFQARGWGGGGCTRELKHSKFFFKFLGANVLTAHYLL